MKPIDYQWLLELTGFYFTDTVRNYLNLPVQNYQFEVTEVEGETYTILRVLTAAGDYHVFVQRHGEMIVNVNSLSGHDLSILRQLE
jgi:hypothetical protein